MLPVGRQDITRGSLKALVYLVLGEYRSSICVWSSQELTLAQVPVYSSATGA